MVVWGHTIKIWYFELHLKRKKEKERVVLWVCKMRFPAAAIAYAINHSLRQNFRVQKITCLYYLYFMYHSSREYYISKGNLPFSENLACRNGFSKHNSSYWISTSLSVKVQLFKTLVTHISTLVGLTLEMTITIILNENIQDENLIF